ncbi:PEP/pyruvate-binding domain-containing protein [Promineifilum sp.]|uniref:PEP/pyruvate-binding domain-containing protein n=1 Tax=Promineifilum sp. TaxID=2664178 RepID=UPI0035B26259
MLLLPFTSTDATLQTAGGKGANLARLTHAGFPVPPGFIAPTAAYRAFVEANELGGVIAASLTGLAADDAARLEAASAAIRGAFARGRVPEEVAAAIREAYRGLAGGDAGDPSVAVRSSATLEDLPDLSFAGQQDTFLNVVGAEALLRAVVDCWSSLWTGRAIGYRARNGLDHEGAALAVIVQVMVPSDVSGVLFTANPLTGLLSESVIDATFGLGEALVAGQVEPDHFVVDARSGAIRSVALGAKAVATRGRPGGGVETRAEDGAARQTLAPGEIRRLVELGQRVQAEYGAPQDIEWALARRHVVGQFIAVPGEGEKNGDESPDYELYLLQSRAITSLFPVPEVSFDPLIIWFSFGAAQGMLEPITPLGRDSLRQLLAGAAGLFGRQPAPEELRVFAAAGERIWVRISDLIRHPVGHRLFKGVVDYLEPSVGQIVSALADDPRLGAGQGRLKLSTLWQLGRVFVPLIARIIRNAARPAAARARLEADIEAYLAEARIPAGADRFERLGHIAAFLRDRLAHGFSFLLPRFVPVLGPSMGSLALLNKLAGDQPALALEVTRALPQNVTTEMDLALWRAAAAIRADAEAAACFAALDAPALAERYLRGALPPAAQTAVSGFLERYGARGVGEIDMGRARWREEPAPVMRTLQSYLQIDPAAAPDVVFARGERAAAEAVEALAAVARRQRGGWLKEKVARAAATRVRLMMGARESPKFFAVRVMGIVRAALLDVGEAFAAAGTIEQADDLFFLTITELESLSRNEVGSQAIYRRLIAERRALYEREARRRQVPRVLVSDGRAFYEGLGALSDAGDVIIGSPVSPGVAEGVVHVVLDPFGTQLAPGEILVCPGTDPGWTPLFLTAGGLITEVGGMMTHGSVVAREYGIPAVVGVHQATSRLKDGQRIRVDGTQGRIVVLDD